MKLPFTIRLASTRFPNLMPTDKRSPSRYRILAQPGPRIGTNGSENSRQQSHSKLEHLQYRFIGFESSIFTTGTSDEISADAVDCSTLLSSTDAAAGDVVTS